MTGAHFPLRVRLCQAFEYKEVFKKGQRQTDSCFTVISLPRDTGPARLGMVVSKKVSRHAVQRNRIKRQIRESFRLHQTHIPAVELVVMARYKTDALSNKELASSLSRHWQRLTK